MVVHSFTLGCLDIRWDDPASLNAGPSFTTVQATGYLLVIGTPDVEQIATALMSVTATPVPLGATVIIGGNPLTCVHAARTPGANNFNGSLGTTALIAAEIANAINDFSNVFRATVTAVAAGSTVTLSSVLPGSTGNAILLGSTSPSVFVPASLTGGADADTVTIAGKVLTAVAGVRTPGGMNFSVIGTNFDIAASLADAINDPLNSLTPYVTASADSGKVTITSVLLGSQGNDITLERSSPSTMTLSGPYLTGGEGAIACVGASNSRWNIVGVNIYRSDTGERGPYFRVNHYPIGGLFFRDCTDNVLVQNEIVNWETGWASRGDAANNRLWRIRTRLRPIVKKDGQAVPACVPQDVTVSIDGVVAPIDAVAGTAGEIDLINLPTYDPSIEKLIPPVLPAEDGSSEVLVTYYRQGNLVRSDLDMQVKIHYRVTTVAVDPTGTTPSGLIETPLGYAPPNAPIQNEKLDYIWREAIRRNRWVLEQGGERVKLFIRRNTGIRCPCQWDDRLFEYAKQPVNNCERCYGTGFLGGFEGPTDIILAPDDAERAVRQTPAGRRLEHTYEVWTGPTPLLSQRDFVVKQNGDRYSIGPVRYTQVRGVILQQAFNISSLDECDIRYKVPIYGVTQLPWPETRYTRPQDVPCEPSDPYPVGYPAAGVPMATEVPKIPDGREQRGRTPVWSSITYGGKGSS
jgi:hypothetical protein